GAPLGPQSTVVDRDEERLPDLRLLLLGEPWHEGPELAGVALGPGAGLDGVREQGMGTVERLGVAGAAPVEERARRERGRRDGLDSGAAAALGGEDAPDVGANRGLVDGERRTCRRRHRNDRRRRRPRPAGDEAEGGAAEERGREQPGRGLHLNAWA